MCITVFSKNYVGKGGRDNTGTKIARDANIGDNPGIREEDANGVDNPVIKKTVAERRIDIDRKTDINKKADINGGPDTDKKIDTIEEQTQINMLKKTEE